MSSLDFPEQGKHTVPPLHYVKTYKIGNLILSTWDISNANYNKRQS